MAERILRIRHKKTGEILAEGPRGWGITPFEGNYYIRSKYVKSENFEFSAIPGVCPYKFIYLWMNYRIDEQHKETMLGWKYIIPNPLLPFIWFRLALPGEHPSLEIEEQSSGDG